GPIAPPLRSALPLRAALPIWSAVSAVRRARSRKQTHRRAEVKATGTMPARPVSVASPGSRKQATRDRTTGSAGAVLHPRTHGKRSEEHTSELQSREKLVCRLL